MNELKNVIFIYHGYYSATKKGGNSAIYNMDEPSEVAQSCPTLCNPMDCSLTGSSIHGIFQARILEWFAISFSRMNLEAIILSQINRSQKVNATWFHFHVESKVVTLTETGSSVQFSSVTQSTLWDPMNRSTPGLPVHHQLLESAQTHVHWVGDAIQPSHPLLSPSPPAFNLSQHRGLFQWVNSSHQVAKVLVFQLQHQSFQWTPRTDLH